MKSILAIMEALSADQRAHLELIERLELHLPDADDPLNEWGDQSGGGDHGDPLHKRFGNNKKKVRKEHKRTVRKIARRSRQRNRSKK